MTSHFMGCGAYIICISRQNNVITERHANKKFKKRRKLLSIKRGAHTTLNIEEQPSVHPSTSIVKLNNKLCNILKRHPKNFSLPYD